MKLVYNIHDRPNRKQLFIFAIQQLLAIISATVAVPAAINGMFEGGVGLSASSALYGAGIGTIVYLLFTGFKSPVFLGSSFAFINSMCVAFSSATVGGVLNKPLGNLGLVLGAFFAGMVYVIIAIVVKRVGTNWIGKIMPAAVIGPVVSIVGLLLSENAISDMQTSKGGNRFIALICALVTLLTIVVVSVYGKKFIKLIPFVIGIGAGYLCALIFTVIAYVTNTPSLQVIDFSPITRLFEGGVHLETFFEHPKFVFERAVVGLKDVTWEYVGAIAAAFIPVAFVVFAEHLADHKNLSTIIEKDLLKDPGLDKTLLGDGVGSMVGALVGGCENTTYGESIGCVAITGNASIRTIALTAAMAVGMSFISPLMALLETIPACVMGGVCVALYGFIAVSGLKITQKVDLEQSKNLFTISVILVAGIGKLSLHIGGIKITEIACALILGIIVNALCNISKKGKNESQNN